MEILLRFSNFAQSFSWTGNLCNLFINIYNFAMLLFTGFKYLPKHYLKYSLSSYWALINRFIAFFNSSGNGKSFQKEWFMK